MVHSNSALACGARGTVQQHTPDCGDDVLHLLMLPETHHHSAGLDENLIGSRVSLDVELQLR